MQTLVRFAALIALAAPLACADSKSEATHEETREAAAALIGEEVAENAPAELDGETTSAGDAQATLSPSPAAKSRGLPQGALRVEPAAIIDATGFEAPMVAATLFVPHGWKGEGGVVWGNEHMCTNGYNFSWRAVAPDGATAIGVLPQDRWEWNNIGSGPSTPGCRLASITDARQYLSALVERVRPGARVSGFRPRPDLARDFAQLNSTTPMPMGETRSWVEAGEVDVAYSENGRAMEASVAAVVAFTLMRTDAGMGVMEALTGYAFPAYAAAAPAGKLDRGLAEAIRKSIKTNPQWEQRIAGHNTAIARTAIAEAGKRSRMISEANAEISRIRQEAWDNYQESSDRRFREFGEVIRGVETYADPDSSTGQVELSHMYDNAWRLNDGTYVLTNDASFEPFRDLGQDGKRLEAVQ